MKQHALRAASLASLGAELLTGVGKNKSRLIQRMGSLHGLPQKIAQSLLSIQKSEVSGDHSTQKVEPVPYEEFCRWLDARIEPEALKLIATIEREGIAASIGQVHKATLRDGRKIAIKAQYPHIRDFLETDLATLGVLSYPLSATMRSKTSLDFDLSEYRSELRESLLRELDYRREEATINRFYNNLSSIGSLCIPPTVPELCTETVISTEWFEGVPLSECRGLTPKQRTTVAEALFTVFLKSTFVDLEFHADPHPGNILIHAGKESIRVGLIDFGATAALTHETAQSLQRLILRKTILPDEIFEILSNLGFNQALLEPCVRQLPRVIEILTEIFFADERFEVAAWKLKEKIEEALGDHRWNFRVAGPATLLPFIRAFVGLVHNLTILDPHLDWRKTTENVLGGIQPHPTKSCDLRNVTSSLDSLRNPLSSALRIKVVESGVPLVQLTLKATLAAELPDLVPPEVIELLPNRGINIQEIANRALSENFAPGELFTLTDGEKSYRVWLE